MDQETLQIIQDDQFYSFMLSREKVAGESSFRVYYTEDTVAVPYDWESQPGTPKHPMADGSPLPPLTPPPSFSSFAFKKKSSKRSLKNKLIGNLLPKQRKPALSYSSSSSSLWSVSRSNYHDFQAESRYSLGSSAVKNAFLEIITCAKFR